MKAFLLRFLGFSLPVLLLLLGLELLQRSLPNHYERKKALLEQQAASLHTLILGSSHTYLGIAPDLLDGPAYNMASTAQTLYYDLFLLERYLDRMPSLRTVMVPVSYSSLGAESDRNPGDYNKSYHYAYFFGTKDFVKPLSARRFSLTALFTVKGSVDRAWGYFMEGDSLIEFRPDGWFATEEQRDLLKNAAESAPFHDRYYDERLHGVNLARLAAIVSRCRMRGVEPVLISMPMHPAYMRQVRADRYAYMTQAADSLSRAHGVRYLNFTEDPRFEDADFFDSNHLRRQGAEKLTRILRDTLARPAGE
ncbi:MAG: hypothetical protein NW241_13145 [Bacteroidia bacterium]|nr:hypothetical protein [Bacteroidia bacterium]